MQKLSVILCVVLLVTVHGRRFGGFRFGSSARRISYTPTRVNVPSYKPAYHELSMFNGRSTSDTHAALMAQLNQRYQNNRFSTTGSRTTSDDFWRSLQSSRSTPQRNFGTSTGTGTSNYGKVHTFSSTPYLSSTNYKPSAPPMELGSKQTVGKSQYAPSAPPSALDNTGGHKPIGFDNVNKQAASAPRLHQGGDYKPSAPPMELGNKQSVTKNQYAPSAPPLQHASVQHQASGMNGSPIGWNVGQKGHSVGYPQHVNYPRQPGYHSGGYGGYHPGPQGGYTSFGSYNPPGSNIHYGPVTYINGYTPAPTYSYFHSSDNTLLSYFVGYQVGRMFSHTSTPYFSGHTYTVHHYHHNQPVPVPEKVQVQANTISPCPQNVTLLCLSNSYPVCMTNGTIMCVTNAELTVKCAYLQCITSTIDCSNGNSSAVCHEKNVTLSAQNTTVLNVPCISSMSIVGDFATLKNVINATLPVNGTFNATDGAASSNTTTVSDTATYATTHTNNVFCVTVIAVPQPLNQTVFNNVTTQAANMTYNSIMADPEVQEKMWVFFGDVLDTIFA